MLDCILDGVIDTLKLSPYLLVTFILLEFIEHKLSKKNQKILSKNKKFGPIFGGILGAVPQCGFSSMAANLFSSRVITIGTLVAVFLSTSDEMLPIMLGEHVDILVLLKILGFKVLVGIIVGIIVDLVLKEKESKEHIHIEDICEKEHCHCSKKGIFVSSIIHTLKICLFILTANLIINIVIFKVGEDNLSHLLLHKNIFVYFLASLIGLIPNCAASVIITNLYVENVINGACLISGLLTGAGVGIMVLFRVNKDLKENLKIMGIVYGVGVIAGIVLQLLGNGF